MRRCANGGCDGVWGGMRGRTGREGGGGREEGEGEGEEGHDDEQEKGIAFGGSLTSIRVSLEHSLPFTLPTTARAVLSAHTNCLVSLLSFSFSLLLSFSRCSSATVVLAPAPSSRFPSARAPFQLRPPACTYAATLVIFSNQLAKAHKSSPAY